MAKKIDFSKPLSKDDAAYAADRPWLEAEYRAANPDVEVSVDAEDEDSDEIDLESLTKSELEAELTNLGVEIPHGAKKADLVTLLDEALAEAEEA